MIGRVSVSYTSSLEEVEGSGVDRGGGVVGVPNSTDSLFGVTALCE